MLFKTPKLTVMSQFEYCGSAAPLCGKAMPFRPSGYLARLRLARKAQKL